MCHARASECVRRRDGGGMVVGEGAGNGQGHC